MRVRRVSILGAVLSCCYTSMLMAEDPVKVDPKHYTVLTENAQVRVLKVHYGPHEKSVMHSHPAAVSVFMSAGNGKVTFANGTTQGLSFKSGDVLYTVAETHMPENTGDQAFDLIEIELKGEPAPATKATTK